MRIYILSLGIALSLMACGTTDPEPLPNCELVCPHALTCDSDTGWSCTSTGESCQDIKPCGDNPPDCEVVCPDIATCTPDGWTCGRPDIPCVSDVACEVSL